MMLRNALFAGGLLVIAAGAGAQTATPMATTAAPIVAGAQDAAVLRIGTKVPLKLSEELTTKGKNLRVGQHFNMEVAEAVLVNGQTVIPAGSPAVGEITDVRNKGMWGKSGRLAAQMLYVSVHGRQVRLTGTFDDKGHAGGGAAVATSAIVFLPAGFFMTGTSAKVPVGSSLTGFIGEDVPVLLSAAPSEPLRAIPISAMPAPPTAPVPASKPAK